MATLNIKIEVELDQEFISNVLITAFDGNYGGCWYWADIAHGTWLRVDDSGEWLGCDIKPKDDEPPHSSYLVDHSTLQSGIDLILSGTVQISPVVKTYITRAIIDRDAGDIDSEAADAIVQVGLFGEIVYG